MRLTIDTNTKQILIQGSFKFEDLKTFENTLPELWRDYSISIEPVIQKEYIWYPWSYKGYNYPSWQYSTIGSTSAETLDIPPTSTGNNGRMPYNN